MTSTSPLKQFLLRTFAALLRRRYAYKVYRARGCVNGTLTLFKNNLCTFRGAGGTMTMEGWRIVSGAPLLFDHYLHTDDRGQTFYSYKLALELESSTWDRKFPDSPRDEIAASKNIFLNVEKIPTRERELLEWLPRNGVAAEIGVETGAYSKLIHTINKPAALHLLDAWETLPEPWPSYEEQAANFRSIQEHFRAEIAAGSVVLHKGDGLASLAQFPDRHFDWIYIDTTHQYEQTLRELQLGSRKVKDGGFVCGHDFCDDAHSRRYGFGVIRAVNEFVRTTDWEFRAITLDQPSTFVLRRKV